MAGDVPSPAPADPAGRGAPAVRLALYRRYRPATFAELKGQDHVTEPLRQALRSGRVNHAYLFSGPRGCGKTSSARILARSLNCEQGPTPDPCGECASCVALAPSGPGSIDVIEIDAASHGGVDDARDLRERAFYAPVAARFKIYIIDEAHMVTGGGFNALLKLVEEPPPHLKFVFATTEPEKVIPTIRSRTHHYPFRLLAPGVLRELLEEILASEDVKYEPAVLPVVIRAGAGSARDSLSILDQLLAGSGDEGLTYERAIALLGFTDESLLDEVTEAFSSGDGAAVFRAVDRVVESGHDPRRFAIDLLDRLRDLIVLSVVPDAGDTGLLDIPADALERLRAQTKKFGQAQLTRAAQVVSAGLVEMRGATSPRLLLELMCAQVLLPAAGPGELAMLARLETLERRTSGAAEAGTSGPGRPAPAGSPARAPDPGPAPAAGRAPRPAGAAGPGQADSAPQAGRAPDDGRAPRPGAQRADSRPPVASTPPVRDEANEPSARPPSSTGRATADSMRERWPEVLEAVRRESNVTWILLGNATVDSLTDGVLTLKFAKEGEAKGFTGSGRDQDLSRALQSIFGAAPQIRATAGGSGAPGRPDGSGGSGDYPGTAPAAAGPDRAEPPGQQTGASQPAAAARPAPARPQQQPARPGEDFPDDPGPHESGPGGQDSGSESLTGMDLIERELGGKVIEELGGG
jgi:DNA polymerase III subunit gamma/tau